MSPKVRLPWLRPSTGSVGLESGEAEPANPGAAAPKSAAPEPAAVEPAPEPAAVEPAPEPAAVELPAAEPASPEPASPEPAATEPAATEPADGSAAGEPQQPEPEDPRSVTVADGVARLAVYRRAVLSWVADDGYPMNVDVEIDVKAAESTVRFSEPPGFRIAPGTPVAITGSHVRPLEEGGFGERSHVTVWGSASARPRGRFAVTPNRVWAWRQDDLPLATSYGLRLSRARSYFAAHSTGRAFHTRPTLSGRLALFRATHAPFLRATFVPLLLALAVAIRAGVIDFVSALITIAVAGLIHLGYNTANGLFDLLHDPGDDRRRPVGSRGAIGAVREAAAEVGGIPPFAVGCYLAAAALGLVLSIVRGSPALVVIAALGALLLVAYSLPPLRSSHRGLGEVSAALEFGPVLLLGTYAIQSRGTLSGEALLLSVPVGLLAGLVVYVGEIPCRAGDARAGRMTLPARWPKALVLRGFDVGSAVAFVSLPVGVVAGLLPIPVLLALLAIPLATRVRADLVRYYDSPSSLTAALAANAQLHMNAGMLLLAGYLLTIADQIFLKRAPFL